MTLTPLKKVEFISGTDSENTTGIMAPAIRGGLSESESAGGQRDGGVERISNRRIDDVLRQTTATVKPSGAGRRVIVTSGLPSFANIGPTFVCELAQQDVPCGFGIQGKLL